MTDIEQKVASLTARYNGPVTIDSATPVVDAYKAMRKSGVHHLVVTRNDDIVGVVSDRNLFEKGLGQDGYTLSASVPVDATMQEGTPVLSEHSTLRDALELMDVHKVSGLPIAYQGKPVGIVTHTDLLQLLQEQAVTPNEPMEEISVTAKTIASHPLGVRLMELLNDIGL